MESIQSFRRITPEEAHDVRGLKISIVTAGPGDTPGDAWPRR